MWEILLVIVSALFFLAVALGVYGLLAGDDGYHPDPVYDAWAELMINGATDLTLEEFSVKDDAQRQKLREQGKEKATKVWERW